VKRWRDHPVFTATLVLAALVVPGEIWFLHGRIVAARAAALRLEQFARESAHLLGAAPAPTPAVAAAVEADLARAGRVHAEMQAGLSGSGQWSDDARVPAARTDAYFELAAFVERMRELARRNDVAVRPEAARFGFAAHVNEAPELARVAAVFRQRLMAEFLLEALFEARPRVLHRIQREPPATAGERAARHRRPSDTPAEEQREGLRPPHRPQLTADGPDYFVIDPRRTARVPGALDTVAFRLVFSGQTAALRLFLNRLHRPELPLLVREIEVKPATPGEIAVAALPEEHPTGELPPPGNSEVLRPAAAPFHSHRHQPEPAPEGVSPIVLQPVSTFAVTIEFVELWPRPTASAAASPPES